MLKAIYLTVSQRGFLARQPQAAFCGNSITLAGKRSYGQLKVCHSLTGADGNPVTAPSGINLETSPNK